MTPVAGIQYLEGWLANRDSLSKIGFRFIIKIALGYWKYDSAPHFVSFHPKTQSLNNFIKNENKNSRIIIIQ